MKEKIESIVNKIKNDPSFGEKFQKEPIKAVEEILGIDLPDDEINKIIEGVKAKIATTNVVDKLKGLFDK